MILQKKISGIGSSLNVSITEAHSFDKNDLSKYKKIFNEYKLKKVIEASSFEDMDWAIVDSIGNKRNLYFDLDMYPDLNSALKCFIIIQISSNFTIQHIAFVQSIARKAIILTEGFKEDKVDELEEYAQKLGYSTRFRMIIYTNKFLQFIEHRYKSKYDVKISSLQEMYNKNRDLPNYEAIVDFHYFMEEFERNSTSFEKEKFFPIILWWKITGLIPMRPKEFCFLDYDCTLKRDSKYFLKIPRSKKKAQSYSELNVENTIRINKEIYESIEEYKDTIPVNLKGKFLFSYEIQSRFLTSKRSYKRRKDVFPPDILRSLLSSFYKEIAGWKTKDFIKIIDNNKEVRNYITPGDTRHFSMCNLMLQGINPLSIAKMAGHVRLGTQRNYWGHIEYFVESFVYILTSKYRVNRLEKELSEGIFGVMDKVDESKIFSPQDFEFVQEVEHGFCRNAIFPENCPGECRYCEHYFFHPQDFEEGIKWLQDGSDLLEQQLTVELRSLLDLYKNMKFNLNTESYSIIDQESALSKANLLNRLIKQKAMLDSLIPETKGVKL
ncbi:site-specific integrase [Psychrobacillus sp. BL-248-WT-3]|uniref:site-specific integrase n=1 Tax=Psychrobacillus sp. BL-248-WT-3 TaxID=2725306 RepID=UPI00146C8685|nr:site-specific integrase [Psychrobacillus sp. BL-248-WT-3]HIT90374.1 site-specific integrase [Candidatus Merdenecus merdavium]